jgi:large subunit ribosomal protein L22
MARFAYSIQGLDPDKTVKASIREADISFKHTREIAINIKGMLLERAKLYLEEVIAMKRSVPFKRYNKK